jgi:hypothetical protein
MLQAHTFYELSPVGMASSSHSQPLPPSPGRIPRTNYREMFLNMKLEVESISSYHDQ